MILRSLCLPRHVYPQLTGIQNCIQVGYSKSRVGKIYWERNSLPSALFLLFTLSPQSPKTLQVTLGMSGSLVAGYLCVSFQAVVLHLPGRGGNISSWCLLASSSKLLLNLSYCPPNMQSLWVVRSFLHQIVRVLMTVLQDRS